MVLYNELYKVEISQSVAFLNVLDSSIEQNGIRNLKKYWHDATDTTTKMYDAMQKSF